jgi:hypothetical protein
MQINATLAMSGWRPSIVEVTIYSPGAAMQR